MKPKSLAQIEPNYPIAQCGIKPFPAPSTSICTVNANEFSTSWKKVPIYMVRFKLPEAIDSPREAVKAYE